MFSFSLQQRVFDRHGLEFQAAQRQIGRLALVVDLVPLSVYVLVQDDELLVGNGLGQDLGGCRRLALQVRLALVLQYRADSDLIVALPLADVKEIFVYVSPVAADDDLEPALRVLRVFDRRPRPVFVFFLVQLFF